MIKVNGASDDLIEIGGDISEEFNPDADSPSYLGFSDGTLLQIEYTDDGIWRIQPLRYGTAKYNKTEATAGDSDNYSDVVELDGEIRWVLCGDQWATTAGK